MKKKQIANRTIVLTAVIGSLLVMAAVIANSIWSTKQTASATDEAVSAVSSFYLEAMADRNAMSVTNQINIAFDEMKKAVTYIEDEDVDSQEELRETIGKIKALMSLSRFALVDKDNIVYTQYTTYTGRSRYGFLAEEQLSGPTVDTVSLYGSSKQLCLAIPTPGLRIMGKTIKACFVQIDIRDIVDMLAVDDKGRTYFCIYSKNGGNLSGTELGPVISKQNFFDATEGILPEDVWEKTFDNFAAEKKGSVTFSHDGNDITLFYVPIEGTGWELAVLIQGSVILDQIHGISERNIRNSRNQIVFTLVAVLLLATVLLLEFRALTRHKLEEEKENSRALHKMANTDSLTGVRNKHAYTENEAALNQQIQNKEIQKLAVIVCDINGLKDVNDNQGHAAGDKLIKDACSLICERFSHGAVFRIGGDEFAVILKDRGFDSMTEDINEFNRIVEANNQKGSVVVSIGWSVLGQDDHSLSDIFERADQMMYERKKELKAMAPAR